MKALKLLSVIFVVLLCQTPAMAKDWKRAKGTLYVTYYEDNYGYTIYDLPASSLVIKVDVDLRNSSRVKGVKTKCRDNRAVKQRVCTLEYRYEIQGHGSCLYNMKAILNNYFSSSKSIYMYLETLVQCPSGYIMYMNADGNIRRS